jgi:hypothetical protein
MKNSTDRFLGRERSDRPAYAGTPYDEYNDLERSLGKEQEKSHDSKSHKGNDTKNKKR